MDLTAIVGLGVVGVGIIVLLRQYKPEYALMVSLMCSVLIFLGILSQLLPAVDEIQAMMRDASVDGKYIAVLLKALGICFITQLAADSCKDAGESAIATKIELAGKLALVVIALPMFQDVVQLALSFLSM